MLPNLSEGINYVGSVAEMDGGKVKVVLSDIPTKSSANCFGDGITGMNLGKQSLVDFLLEGAFRLSGMELLVCREMLLMILENSIEGRGSDMLIAQFGHRKGIADPVIDLIDLGRKSGSS